MVRTVWIGLVCLIAICGLTAYKIGFAAPAKNQAASVEPLSAVMAFAQDIPATRDAAATQDDPPARDAPIAQDAAATKTDRLDVDYFRAPGKTLVHTIPIVISDPAIPATPAEREKAAPPEKVEKIVSRHWRASYARLTRRHIRRQREVARPPTNEVKTASTGLLGWLKPAAK